MIEMVSVSSSNIDSIGYDSDTSTLRVTFNSGATYDYEQVPYDVWQGFLDAPSKGHYFHRNVRDMFKFEQVRLANHSS